MENINYFKLQILLNECRTFCKFFFLKKWKEITNYEWQNNIKSGTDLKKILGKNIINGLDKCQKKKISAGLLDEWDISLFLKILNCSGFNKDISNQALGQIKQSRNMLAHLGTLDLSEAVFIEHSENLVKSLIELNASSEDLSKLKEKMNILNERIRSPASKTPRKEFTEIKAKANNFFSSKNYEKALLAYNESLQTSGIDEEDKSIIYNNRAACYFKMYEIEQDLSLLSESLNDAKLSLICNPFYAKPYYRIGLIHELKKKEEKALGFFEKAMILAPGDQELQLKIADLRKSAAEKKRMDHLNPDMHPTTYEEGLQNIFSKMKNTRGGEWNLEDAFELRKKIEKEDPTYVDLFKGHDYRDGTNEIKPDLALAATYYAKAANKGSAEALYNLGLLTEKGSGVKKNILSAIELYKKAASMPPFKEFWKKITQNIGVRESQHCLGNHYFEGIGVEKKLCFSEKMV